MSEPEKRAEAVTGGPSTPLQPVPHAELVEMFRHFDREIAKVEKLPDPKTFEESRDILRPLIDALPQRAAIRTDHADRWLPRTMRVSIDRMELEKGVGKATVADVHKHVLWHIRRASSIGGSEIGTLVKHFRGQPGGFSNASRIVMEKLLILSPMPGNENMSRGIRAEPWLQKIYHHERGTRSDTEYLKALRGFRWDRNPQNSGTPDDIVIWPDDDGTPGRPANGLGCIDYKSPSKEEVDKYKEEGISFDYVCQLHHYAVLAMACPGDRRRKFDWMSIEAFDAGTFKIVTFDVPFDQDLAREMMTASRKIWSEFVMMGIVPDKLEPAALQVEDDGIVDLAYQLTYLKVLEDDVKARKIDMQRRIAALGNDWHGLSEGRINLDIASFDRTRAWNEDHLVDLAEAAQVDITPFRKEKKDFDSAAAEAFVARLTDAIEDDDQIIGIVQDTLGDGKNLKKKPIDLPALAAHLAEIGVDTLGAAEISERFNLTRKKKGPEVERLSEIKAEVSDFASMIEDTFARQAVAIREGRNAAVEDMLEDQEPEMEM